MLVITEEMLRDAANKASEALTAYYERDYDPQKPLEIPLEFKKLNSSQEKGKWPILRTIFHRFIEWL